ncbi:MAG: D-2-hydroxyacid dehydrogenase [Firmicutes bacterium HGW-Firmicutes-12]|jgi:phosphoglycerate dehydrogenase-like enzyme|nr:MAG: D-2-hydroxyacid dehydrogenase [Firmicutes bacterium HGW-Firmicutes-12]
MDKRILVLVPVEDHHKVILESATSKAIFTYSSIKTVTKEQVESTHIVIGNIPISLLEHANNLEWLQLNSSGVGAYSRWALQKNFTLTCATGIYGLAVSEHILGLILSLYKKLYLYRDNQLSQAWVDEGPVKTIEGSIALIVGLGDIGSTLAKKLKALGAYTIGVRRLDLNKPNYVDELYPTEKLDELLPRADIITFILPDTKDTYHLVNERRLNLMKNDAILINTGRGSLIDQDALCNVLDTGKLLAVGLDVTNPEPLPANHRLWGIKNVIITPHVSGDYHLKETHERLIQLTATNLHAFFNDKELTSLVDHSTGYRR